MKISEAIAQEQQLSPSTSTTFYLDGHIEKDSEEGYFRIYRNPLDKKRYHRVRLADVSSEIHQWSEHELAHSGYVGQARFRVPVPYGTVVEVVSVSIQEIGKTIAGHTGSRGRGRNLVSGECEYSPGCGGHNCCTYGDDGECYCDDCCEA
jgi:hypothetical protein